jgi:hypothetical protein
MFSAVQVQNPGLLSLTFRDTRLGHAYQIQ